MELKKKGKPQVYKAGDFVKIINPEFVHRVGYPLDVNAILLNHWTKEDDDKMYTFLRDMGLYNYNIFKQDHAVVLKVRRKLAQLRLENMGYGGRTRSLHKTRSPDFQDTIMEVRSKRTVKTGTYIPGYTKYDSYYGDHDYEFPSLAEQKTHVLLNLVHCYRTTGMANIFMPMNLEIESINVELVKK